MSADKIIVAVIVVVVLYAHWWIYQWVKFKVDEAVINKHIINHGKTDLMTVKSVSSKILMSEQRVAKVCGKSHLDTLKKLIK